jgi:hypothetical protein
LWLGCGETAGKEPLEADAASAGFFALREKKDLMER